MRATYGARLATLLDLRGLALIDAGEHAAAVPLYDEAITLKDDDRGLWLHRALARVGLGEHPAALRDLDECVARGGEGGDADARFLQAKLHLLCKDLHAARRAADLALSAEPGHDGATELRAAMEECAAVYSEEATKLVLLGSPAEAVANLTHAIELRPDDANLLVRRGAALRREGRLEEAAADLEAAISRGGAAAADGRRVLAHTLNDAGVRLALAERFAEAVPCRHAAGRASPQPAGGGEAAPAGDGSVVDVLEAAMVSLGAALEQLDARSGGARVLHKMVSTQDEGVKRIGRLLAAADMAAVRAATEGRLEAPTTPPADTTDES